MLPSICSICREGSTRTVSSPVRSFFLNFPDSPSCLPLSCWLLSHSGFFLFMLRRARNYNEYEGKGEIHRGIRFSILWRIYQVWKSCENWPRNLRVSKNLTFVIALFKVIDDREISLAFRNSTRSSEFNGEIISFVLYYIYIYIHRISTTIYGVYEPLLSVTQLSISRLISI